MIPTGKKTALVIDLVKRDSRSWISYYALDNDARPPITAFRSNNFDLYTSVKWLLSHDMMYTNKSMNDVIYKNPIELTI